MKLLGENKVKKNVSWNTRNDGALWTHLLLSKSLGSSKFMDGENNVRLIRSNVKCKRNTNFLSAFQ